jgi:hypothetical protein
MSLDGIYGPECLTQYNGYRLPSSSNNLEAEAQLPCALVLASSCAESAEQISLV